ncbi:hypothetical protein [Nocardia gamkensis]|jgi:hypothetical protein|uniref:Uncharacterized protein n=1 Tax=Nocardia gamkensis TaxID=352869 RepID=A0A7X6LAH3_9NOCA|nr:hypothetical protein [Nocardia gamkensis]NKY30482.1 hypothetical protein [Nocardia gamkensis]NQE70648.1 hypothetical protein [Nocardia gamkensis]
MGEDLHPFTRALNTLIDGMHPPTGNDGRPHQITHRALAADIHRATGARLSANYLWKLRTGQAVNPSYETLEVFRGYFGLASLDPFTEPRLAATRGNELALINALKGNAAHEALEPVLRDGLRQGTVRAESVLAMLNVLRRIENEQR